MLCEELLMNIKYRDILFFLVCCLLIFNNTSEVFRINFIGGVLRDKLIFYPLIIGCIYTLWYTYKYKVKYNNFQYVKIFIIVYTSILIFSLINGLFMYPYYDSIFNGPINQIEKLPKVLNWLQEIGIVLDKDVFIVFWMIFRIIKNMLLEIICTFLGAYLIYYWYCNDWKQGLNILFKAIMVSIVCIFIYSILEIFYLGNNETAKYILTIINPYIHIIEQNNNWWPPLLWNNQLRSVFAEPSYFGIYVAFAMPFLWYKFMSSIKYKWLYILIMSLFMFCLFLTKARTGIALFSGEIILLILGIIYLNRRILLRKLGIIICCCVISFVSANLFITNVMINHKDMSIDASIENYLDDNIGSLASTGRRSNNSRYSIMIADLKIGIEYPILGIGSGLRDAYIPEYLPEMSIGNKEVNRWIINQEERGILKSGFPKLGEYTSRFAETGILGLVAFLVPPIFLLINLLKKIKKEKDLRYVAFTISFIGIMAAGIGDSINITYCYWVLLGLGYAMCFGKPGDEIKHE